MSEFSTLNGYKVKDKKAIRFYDTVADMKADTTLKDGMYIITKGYYAINDGGISNYYITSNESNSEYQEELNNGLFATLIIDDYVTPEQFGCYGDGIHDDTENLQNLIDLGFAIKTTGNYLISSTLNIVNSFEMEGNSYIKIASNFDGDVGVLVATTNQRIGMNYNINVDAQNNVTTAIGISKPRKCKLNLKVINAGNTGINCNYSRSSGNNENEFSCNVVGNTNGTTETGVLVNNFDSIFHAIVTQDCKYGVKLDQGELIANSVHAWLSDDVASTLWGESAVIYNVSLYTLQVNWLYQDSVKYGVLGASYGHINYFEYNNTLTNSENYTGMYNVYAESGSSRLTINRFKNDKNENLFLKYDIGSGVASEFGVLIKNGVQSNPNVIRSNPAFTDLNNAPQWGSFYVNYDCSNVPTSTNGYVECKVVGSVAIQTYYCQNYNDVPRFFMRTRELTTSTWSTWKKFTGETTN